MPFEEISIPSPRETIVREIESQIIRGKLRPGEKLPTERELAAKIGVSKSVVHFGLIELERLGFVTVVPRQGVYAADYARTGNAETLNEVLRFNGGRLNYKMSVELVELRNAIEGGALVRLAAHHTDEDLAALRAVLDELKAAREADLGIPETAAIESRFHYLIIERSGNDMFALVMNSFSSLTELVWQYCEMYWGVDGFIAHDERLIELLAGGEGAAARDYIECIFKEFLAAWEKIQ